jgi:hypothetical protein
LSFYRQRHVRGEPKISDDRSLREKVREIVRAGKLPNGSPDHIWGGMGTGAECAICGGGIGSGDIELEVRFPAADSGGKATYIVHLRCFSILEDERQNITGGPIPWLRLQRSPTK